MLLPKRRRPLNVIHGSARFSKFNRARGNSGELCCRGGEQRDECSTGKVAYGEDHSRPDGAHSRLLKTAGAIPLKPDIP